MGIVYRIIETYLIGPGSRLSPCNPCPFENQTAKKEVAKTAGFSLHAGVAANAHYRHKLERLCCHIAHPGLLTDRP